MAAAKDKDREVANAMLHLVHAIEAQNARIDKLVKLISGEIPVAPRASDGGPVVVDPYESPARRALRERVRQQVARDRRERGEG